MSCIFMYIQKYTYEVHVCLYTSTKQKANYELHTHKFRNCILFVYLSMFKWDVYVHKCVGNTFMGMHACACSAQRLVSFTAL